MTPTGPPPARRPLTVATLLDRPGIARLGRPRRYATGFDMLDEVLGGGIEPAELLVVGGPPGVGKTTAVLQWARWMALAGVVVVYASAQHEERHLLGRLLAMELAAVAEPADPALADARRLLQGIGRGGRQLTPAAASPLVQRTAARLRSYGDRLALLQASPTTTVADVRRLLDERAGDDVALFLDPLEAIANPRGPVALREMALALDVAVVAVCAGAPDSAAAEADIVVMLHDGGRPGRHRSPGDVIFSVDKNRRGERSAPLRFQGDFANGRFDPAGQAQRARRAGGRLAALMGRTSRNRA